MRQQVARALGFGSQSLWWANDLLVVNWHDDEDDTNDEYYFTGSAAIAAYRSAGGVIQDAEYAGVPLQLQPVPNTLVGQIPPPLYWPKSIFGQELLTPFPASGSPSPLSIVTLAAMEDLGYTKVDYDAADEFRVVTVPDNRIR